MIDRKRPLPRKSRYNKWTNISEKEIKAFIAVEMGMGLMHKSSLASYFSSAFWLTVSPGFSSIFTRDRYEMIRAALHFTGTEQRNDDRLYKIRPILDIVKDLYTSVYKSDKEICIDETMIRFKGRLFFKQYLPSKPSAKWGIKIFSMCDSHNGYLLRFSVYTGKEIKSQPKVGLGATVVHTLLEGFEDMGYIVYMDNFYSSVNLFLDLKLKNIGACGTVRVDRKGLPPGLSKIQQKRGDLPLIWVNEGNTLLACTWRDTGRVNMLSTVGDSGICKVKVNSKMGERFVDKPNVQVMYNKFMGGVDTFDQLCSTYPFNRKTKKWYQTIYHFIIEAALVNSRICYNIQNPGKKMSQISF